MRTLLLVTSLGALAQVIACAGSVSGGTSSSSSSGGSSSSLEESSSSSSGAPAFTVNGTVDAYTGGATTITGKVCKIPDTHLNCSTVGTGTLAATGDFSMVVSAPPATSLPKFTTPAVGCASGPSADPTEALWGELLLEVDGTTPVKQLFYQTPTTATVSRFGFYTYADQEFTASGTADCGTKFAYNSVHVPVGWTLIYYQDTQVAAPTTYDFHIGSAFQAKWLIH